MFPRLVCNRSGHHFPGSFPLVPTATIDTYNRKWSMQLYPCLECGDLIVLLISSLSHPQLPWLAYCIICERCMHERLKKEAIVISHINKAYHQSYVLSVKLDLKVLSMSFRATEGLSSFKCL